MHIRSRLFVVPAVLATVLMSLAACGGSDDQSSSSSESDPQQVLVERTKDGIGDSGSVHVVSKFSNGSGEGDSVYGESFLADVTMEVVNLGTISVLADDDVTYMNVQDQTPEGKYGALAPDNVIASTLRLGVFDPLATVAVFEAATSVEGAGSEEIDGVSTDHYKVTVPSADAQQALGMQFGDESVEPEFVYDVYLDADDQIVRLVFDGVIGQHVEMDMSAWGDEVTIDLPSKKDIIPTS